uniref:Uncharacterized protein n=1 Tax=Chromera velia CCMP2878 TaxID=1169474 RepID=A0A0G4FBY2_9ALVE|eukprot:Cvel_16234.t1-p1 / transcript=Cvel_16234.t1 / gene=Cvel_16234 / organism=Chromera_velia_CCMP2878 / gene_product=Sodium/glucose cotransporter 4, putative / transcript_product=Sodium/glucose cotransporter 4, putative / location=Cvel_scaffold1241:44004-46605(+) / protein_length=807 / sequence_SO=supercontig / SO=protein_coding / is_pseudo=false
MVMNFSALDYGVFAVVAVAFAVTIWLSARNRAKAVTTDEYFLTCRSMTWWTIGFSLYASNIGTEHLVGQAGAAAGTGLGVASYEIAAGTFVVLLGFLYYPVYRAANVSTVPEYFEKRFNPLCRYLLVVYSLVSWVMVRVAAPLFGASVIFDVILKMDMWVSSVVVVVVTVAYGIFGGLAAVMYTDVLQAGIFTTAGLVGMFVVYRVFPGGLSELQGTLASAGQTEFFDILRPWDDKTYPWTGLIFGSAFVSTWYWNADQVMVQRVLASRSLFDAQTGVIVGALLKTVTVFAIHFPGMAARALYETCVHSEGSMFEEWCTPSLAGGSGVNKAYPLLVARHFPSGLLGLVVCGWIAALMSSLDSVLNSSAHLVAHDFWKRTVRRSASDRELMWVGRITVLLVAAVALGWLPMIVAGGGAFYLFTQNAMSHVAPAVGAVLLLAVLVPCRRWSNGAGAVGGLLFGLVFGICRFVVHVAAKDKCEAMIVDNRIKGPLFECMNFNNFALFSGLLSILVTVLISVSVDLIPCIPERLRERLRGGEPGLDGLTIWSAKLSQMDSEDAVAAATRKERKEKEKEEREEKKKNLGGDGEGKETEDDVEMGGMRGEEGEEEERREDALENANRAEEGGNSDIPPPLLFVQSSPSSLSFPPSPDTPPPPTAADTDSNTHNLAPPQQVNEDQQPSPIDSMIAASPISLNKKREQSDGATLWRGRSSCETEAEEGRAAEREREMQLAADKGGMKSLSEEKEGTEEVVGIEGGGAEKRQRLTRRILLGAAIVVVLSRFALLFTFNTWAAFPLDDVGAPIWEEQ